MVGRDLFKTYNLLKAIQTTTQDVGYYAPAARTYLNLCVPCTIAFQISASPCLQSISSGYPSESLAAKHRQLARQVGGFTKINLANSTASFTFNSAVLD